MDNEDAEPRTLMLQELGILITERQEAGDKIIIGIDANEDIRGPTIQQFLSDYHLKEAVTSRHGHTTPSTCDKNTNNVPIDGILLSADLDISATGYLPFGDGPRSDHRVLWADITKSSALGDYRRDDHFKALPSARLPRPHSH